MIGTVCYQDDIKCSGYIYMNFFLINLWFVFLHLGFSVTWNLTTFWNLVWMWKKY